MNRRTRRARRRLRRGDARREPLLLLAEDRYPGQSFEALVRCVYRYRSELAPPALAGALALTGMVLHGHFPHTAPFVAVLTAAVAAGWSRPEITPDLRRIERGYAITLTIAAGLWLTFATAHGPGVAPLPALLIFGTIVGGLPWWAHRRRRAKVRVERTLEAWPDIADAVGLPGSRVMSAVVDLWGWRARIGLRRGQTVSDLMNRVPVLESGLGTRPGAVRVEPDPHRADHALIRVLHADPHAHAIPYPTDPHHPASITRPVPLGLFEDARPVTLTLTHRHGLLGGVAGAGKSGVLNIILAALTACPDVVLWGIDLKGGMELGPWASCLGRLATTASEAAELLADAVAILDARALHLKADGSRLWRPTPTTPALLIVIDEYAELAEQSPVAVVHADSLARRGRAVALTLLAATQRPTQKAMGSGAVRSQMDIRICLRVRERRDVDLILGQGMLAAGWHAHTLDAPGKFLLSTPEHHTPHRARAYLLTDHDVSTLAARHHPNRPLLDPLSQHVAEDHNAARSAPPIVLSPRTAVDEPVGNDDNPNIALWVALRRAPGHGLSVRELMVATGMSRSWVYYRLHEHASTGRAVQVSRGRWVAASNPEDNDRDNEAR